MHLALPIQAEFDGISSQLMLGLKDKKCLIHYMRGKFLVLTLVIATLISPFNSLTTISPLDKKSYSDTTNTEMQLNIDISHGITYTKILLLMELYLMINSLINYILKSF